jgi:hypothetical protein
MKSEYFPEQPGNMMPYHTVAYLFAGGYADAGESAAGGAYIHHQQSIGIGLAGFISFPELMILFNRMESFHKRPCKKLKLNSYSSHASSPSALGSESLNAQRKIKEACKGITDLSSFAPSSHTNQTANFALPFALLAAITFLPPALAILALKP